MAERPSETVFADTHTDKPMMILNPPFLRRQPPRSAQTASLLALRWAALPRVSALPLVVIKRDGGDGNLYIDHETAGVDVQPQRHRQMR